MKNIFESGEVMVAYAEIDLAYYQLQEIAKKSLDNKPKSGLDVMIDKATGYGKAKDIETIKSLIACHECIIANKKFIEADYSDNKKLKKELENLLLRIEQK